MEAFVYIGMELEYMIMVKKVMIGYHLIYEELTSLQKELVII